MIIGVDLDGVVFDSEPCYLTLAEVYDMQINGGGVARPDNLRIEDRYDWDKEIADKFYEQTLLNVYKTAPVMIYAKQVLEKLRKSGHKLVAITARGWRDAKAINLTKKRLKKEKIKFDKFCFCQKDKLQACKAEKIDLMIEDLYKTVKMLSENGIKCLHMNNVISKTCKNENVIAVKNWGEIYRQLVKLGIIEK